MSNIGLIKISSPDQSGWFDKKLPLEMKVIRELKSNDGSQYILSELLEPILKPDGIGVITHLIVGGRIEGRPLQAGFGGTPANIAYVKDQSILEDETVDFTKAEFICVAEGSCLPASSLPHIRRHRESQTGRKRKIVMLFIGTAFLLGAMLLFALKF